MRAKSLSAILWGAALLTGSVIAANTIGEKFQSELHRPMQCARR